MGTFNVPNQFVPQSGQVISSSQVDQNFDAVADELNNLENQLGGGTGTFTDVRKVQYQQRPVYLGTAAPQLTEFVDRKWVEATRGCQIGDLIFSINPNALPNDYGVVWAKMTGQQLSQTTYASFYGICTTIGGTNTGRYNPAAGATSGNFTAPDWRGGIPMQILEAGALITSTCPNFGAANWAGSVVGESKHTQLVAEMPSHHHGVADLLSLSGGSVGNGSGNGQFTGNTSDTGGGSAFNIVQNSFVSFIWVRIL